MRSKTLAKFFLVLPLAFVSASAYPAINDDRLPSSTADGFSSTPVQNPHPALVLTRQWLPRDIFRLLLPITLTINKPDSSSPESFSLTVSDIQFVGIDGDWKRAKAFAIAVPGSSPNPAIGAFLSNVEANADLKSIRDRAVRIPNGPDWLIVMSINAVWSPWRLRLTVRAAEFGRRSGAATSPPSFVEEAFRIPASLPQLLDMNLSQINAPIDASTALQLNVAMSFGTDTITFAFIPTTSAAAWQLPPPGTQGLRVDTMRTSPDTSAVFSIPHSFTNNILNLVYGNKPLSLGVNVGGWEPKVSSLKASTVTDAADCPDPCFTLSGNINRRQVPQDPAVPVSIDWAGSDLRLSNLRVKRNVCQAEPECGQLEFFAKTAALLLMPQYQGRLLRPPNVREIGQFNLSGKTIAVDLLLQNTKVAPTGLSASGYVTLRIR